ncbi:MAG: hypothetical protein ABL958_01585 [Bdellovibrionia bacterium]
MKKWSVNICLVCLISFPSPARSSMFGEETAVLIEILANAVKQLHELQAIVNAGQDTLGLLRDINRGINDSLYQLKTIYPDIDPGIYKEWDKVQTGLQKIESIYGIIAPSKEFEIQRDTDRSVAEAVALNNNIYDYSNQIDAIGEEIKNFSHVVSPGGAQKLTAQSMGIMLHVMSQSLRAQATGLKLQAQTVALQNKKEKDMTKHFLESSKTLKTALKNKDTSFELPRF